MGDIKRMKMAFVDLTNYKDWPVGGMLSYELSILNNLVKEFDVDLWGVSVDGKTNEYIEINHERYKINIFANVTNGKKVMPNFWKGLGVGFSNEFWQREYDVIYAHSGSCMTGASLLRKKKDIIFVYHQHGLSYLTNHSLMSYTQKPFYWYAQRVAKIVFLVTDKMSAEAYANRMKNKSKARFIGIGSPIDLSEFDSVRINQRLKNNNCQRVKSFVYVGRLSPEKNIKQMIEAFNKYRIINKSNAVLHLVGDGPDRLVIEETVTKLDLKNAVIFHGAKTHKEALDLLANSDVFLITSKGEGVSIAVLEAYASGLPVVCFPVPGLKAQIIDCETGKIASDMSTESFAEAMKYAEDNKTYLARKSLEFVKTYDVSEISKTIIEEIKS